MKTILLVIVALIIGMARGDQDDPGFKLYLEGNNYVLKSKWDDAIKKFDQLLTKHPKSNYADDAMFWKAYALKETKKETQSVDAFATLLDKYPSTSFRSDAINNLVNMKSKLNKSYQEKVERILKSRGVLYAPRDAAGNSSAYILNSDNEGITISTNSDYNIAVPEVSRVFSTEYEQVYDLYGRYAGIGSTTKLTEEEQIEVEAIKSYYNTRKADSKEGLKKLINSNSKSVPVKNVALRYYIRVENDYDEIIDLYDNLKSELFKRTILNSIYRFKNGNESDIIDFTSDVVMDKKASYELKKAALYSLTRVDNAFDELEDAYQANQHLSLRKTIISTMTRKYPTKSKDFMMSIIKNKTEKESTRKNAVYYLSRNVKDFNKLKGLYDSLDNENLKKEVIYSFYKLDTDDSINYLINLMKDKKTPVKIRKSIIYYLGRSKNPKANKAISDILFD